MRSNIQIAMILATKELELEKARSKLLQKDSFDDWRQTEQGLASTVQRYATTPSLVEGCYLFGRKGLCTEPLELSSSS